MSLTPSLRALYEAYKLIEIDDSQLQSMTAEQIEAHLLPAMKILDNHIIECITKLLPDPYHLFFEPLQYEFVAGIGEPSLKVMPDGSIPEAYGFEVIENTLNDGDTIFEKAVSNMGSQLFFPTQFDMVYRVISTPQSKKLFNPAMKQMLHGELNLHLFRLAKSKRTQFINDSSRHWNVDRGVQNCIYFYSLLMKSIASFEGTDESLFAWKIAETMDLLKSTMSSKKVASYLAKIRPR